MHAINAFIKANTKAFNVFCAVARDIESRSLQWQLTLAEAGILPGDYRAFIVAYVATETKTQPHEGKFGGLTFTKGSTAYNRAEYLTRVLNGGAAAKAAARKESADVAVDPAALKAAKALLKTAGSYAAALAALKAAK